MDRRYSAILFDLDGTLVDSISLILASYRHTMSEHLGRVLPDKEWLSTLGRPLRIQLQNFARSPEEVAAMFETYTQHNQAHHEELVRPFPGMSAAVNALHDAGYHLGVVTSKIRPNTERELRTVGMSELFEVVVTADDVEKPKPAPDPVHLAARQLELDASETLLVGDSVYDIRSGRAAGAGTAAALWGPFDRRTLAAERPDYILERIDSLLALLGLEHPGRDGRQGR